jgi:hypothetical protein
MVNKNTKIEICIWLDSNDSYVEQVYKYSMFLTSIIFYCNIDLYIRSDFSYEHNRIFHKIYSFNKEIDYIFYKW